MTSLRVRSDLHLSVDGVAADLSADGPLLTLRTDDAVGFAAAVRASAPGSGARAWRAQLDRAATALESAGLSARVVGPRGTLLELGSVRPTRPARLLLGTGRARFGPTRSLAATAADWLRSAAARRRGASGEERT